jgi:hypothetical protein
MGIRPITDTLRLLKMEQKLDILERLRASMAGFDTCLHGAAMAREAADEIEHLRALLQRQQASYEAELENDRQAADNFAWLAAHCSVTYTYRRADGKSDMVCGPVDLTAAIDASRGKRHNEKVSG